MAPSPRPGVPVQTHLWTRRRLLITGAWSALGATSLSGCSLSNPAVNTPSTAPALPTPPGGATPSVSTTPPRPGYPGPAAQEQSLADLAAALRRRKGVPGETGKVLDLMVTAHTDHARVLVSPEPAARQAGDAPVPAARTPSVEGLDLDDALRVLAEAENSLAGRHRSAAVAASGLTALLWGSLALAAEGFASVDDEDPPAAVALRPHRPAVLLSDVAATQQMVAQLHAIVWGYQLAAGKLEASSNPKTRAVAGLLQRRVLRDRLMAWLTAREADVPVSEASYAPPRTPTDAGSAGRLIGAMETALLPYCGLWLAAAGTEADRQLALDTLRSTARTARSWGAGVRGWPGWSD